jgi:diacylglycerol kinase family enzyme
VRGAPVLEPLATPYDRVAVVVNGNAKRVTEDLVQILDQIVQSGDLFVSRSLDEGKRIAETIVERGYATVLTGGGDGTFVQMVTWIVHAANRRNVEPPRFGLLKLGTGNALAWVLGAQNPRGRGVVADLARVRREGGSGTLRLLELEGTLSPFAGLGIDAEVLKYYGETKEMLSRIPVLRRFAAGGLAYAIAIGARAMPQYLLHAHRQVRIVNEGGPVVRMGVSGQPVGREIERGEIIFEGPSRMVCMSTIPYWGFGARVFPFANDRSDRFSMRVVDIGSVEFALHFPELWRGTYRGSRVHDFLVERASIHYADPMPLQIGGDIAGERRSVEVRLYPKPVQVVDFYAPPPIPEE